MNSHFALIITILLLTGISIPQITYGQNNNIADQCGDGTTYFYDIEIRDVRNNSLGEYETPLRACHFDQIFFENNHMIYLDENLAVRDYDLTEIVEDEDYNWKQVEKRPISFDYEDVYINDISAYSIIFSYLNENTEDYDQELMYYSGDDLEITYAFNLEKYNLIPQGYSQLSYFGSYQFTERNETGRIVKTLNYHMEPQSLFGSEMILIVYQHNNTVYSEGGINVYSSDNTTNYVFRYDVLTDSIESIEWQTLPTSFNSSERTYFVADYMTQTGLIVVNNEQVGSTLYIIDFNDMEVKFTTETNIRVFDSYSFGQYYIDRDYIQFGSYEGIITIYRNNWSVVNFEYAEGYERFHFTGSYFVLLNNVPGNAYFRSWSTEYTLYVSIPLIILLILFIHSYRKYKKRMRYPKQTDLWIQPKFDQ